jgi:hypothetical protein
MRRWPTGCSVPRVGWPGGVCWSSPGGRSWSQLAVLDPRRRAGARAATRMAKTADGAPFNTVEPSRRGHPLVRLLRLRRRLSTGGKRTKWSTPLLACRWRPRRDHGPRSDPTRRKRLLRWWRRPQRQLAGRIWPHRQLAKRATRSRKSSANRNPCRGHFGPPPGVHALRDLSTPAGSLPYSYGSDLLSRAIGWRPSKGSGEGGGGRPHTGRRVLQSCVVRVVRVQKGWTSPRFRPNRPRSANPSGGS